MKSVGLLGAGVVIGLTIQTGIGIAQQNRWLVGLNHIAISVPDMGQATTFYTNALGLKEAFVFRDAEGKPTLTYLQISRDTFIELQPATSQRPAGFMHMGLQVDNMDRAIKQVRSGAWNVADPTFSERSKSRLAQGSDPFGNRIELLELGPDSAHRKAMDSWK